MLTKSKHDKIGTYLYNQKNMCFQSRIEPCASIIPFYSANRCRDSIQGDEPAGFKTPFMGDIGIIKHDGNPGYLYFNQHRLLRFLFRLYKIMNNINLSSYFVLYFIIVNTSLNICSARVQASFFEYNLNLIAYFQKNSGNHQLQGIQTVP